MRRVLQGGTPITDFGGRRKINFDALFSSDSDSDGDADQAPASSASASTASASTSQKEQQEQQKQERPPSPENDYQGNIADDPISVWTQKVVESFEKASETKKPLTNDFKESLGRLSFFRKLVTKEKSSTSSVDSQ